jgi:hypothetical protein
MLKVTLFLVFIVCIVCIVQLMSICYCPSYPWSERGKNTFTPKAEPLLMIPKLEITFRASKSLPAKESDGTFNGFDIFYVDHPPKSSVHCVGDNFDEDRGWMYRSCEFKTLCYNLDKGTFVYYLNSTVQLPGDFWWSATQRKRNRTNVAGGSQPRPWFPIVNEDIWNRTTKIGMFSPEMKVGQAPSAYYRLKATMLPFYRHPTSYRNPGHLLWDDFLPLYTLLDIFDRENDRLYLAHMRRESTEEFEEWIPDFDIIDKYLPLLGDHQYNIEIENGFDFSETNSSSPRFKDGEELVVCADHGLTGGGLFADHASHRWHGQTKRDLKGTPNNLGRGGLLRRFRRFMMKNLGISPDNKMQRAPKYQIIVSQNSSTKGTRGNITFADHIQALSSLESRLEVRAVKLPTMSLYEQIEMTSTAAFYVTTVGGGSSTAMFLPKGAHLLLFYRRMQPLDWDLWNNFPHIKVHWLPFNGRDANGTILDPQLDSFFELIRAELNTLDDATIA